MNQYLGGSIYGRSSIKIAHFGLIREQTWLPQAILVSDWSISKNLILMNNNLVGSTYGRFCIKFLQSRMKDERHRFKPKVGKNFAVLDIFLWDIHRDPPPQLFFKYQN